MLEMPSTPLVVDARVLSCGEATITTGVSQRLRSVEGVGSKEGASVDDIAKFPLNMLSGCGRRQGRILQSFSPSRGGWSSRTTFLQRNYALF